jgi:hypothetical protein
MATTIKSIPILKSKDAQVFDAKVAENNSKKSTVNFTEQSEIAQQILKKAKL